jgi:deazaflavin-dependent oxidoreductase (nitroreductase family)
MSENKPAAPTNWVEEHIRLYKTDPEKAHLWDSSMAGGTQGMIPTLLLTTTGRKSGKAQSTPLIYSEQCKGFAVIASKGGAPTHPAWYLNLEANPDVEIQVGPKHYHARARTAGPEERAAIWADMLKLYPPYDRYQARAPREIPVVVFDPK